MLALSLSIVAEGVLAGAKNMAHEPNGLLPRSTSFNSGTSGRQGMALIRYMQALAHVRRE